MQPTGGSPTEHSYYARQLLLNNITSSSVWLWDGASVSVSACKAARDTSSIYLTPYAVCGTRHPTPCVAQDTIRRVWHTTSHRVIRALSKPRVRSVGYDLASPAKDMQWPSIGPITTRQPCPLCGCAQRPAAIHRLACLAGVQRCHSCAHLHLFGVGCGFGTPMIQM